MKKRIFAVLLALALTVSLLPLGALAAEGDTINMDGFIEAVKAAEYNYDGHGVTVKWSPSSGCWQNHTAESDNCFLTNHKPGTEPDGNTPQRLQNNNAQYQIFSDVERQVTIKNVKFVFKATDVEICTGTGTGNSWGEADKTYNAELQFLNAGGLTIENCDFTNVIVSPYCKGNNTADDTVTTITNCSFSDVYNAYAIKDIYTGSAYITGCKFDRISGAIYFEGDTARSKIKISGNTFNNVDQYAAPGKENTRGVIQLSSSFTMGDNTTITIEDNEIVGNTPEAGMPVIRQRCDLDGHEIIGWTPGDMFTILVDSDAGVSNVTLPSLPSDSANIFLGWADSHETNEVVLEAGATTTTAGMYYSVWQTLTLEGTKSAAWIYGQQSRTAEVTLTIPGVSYVLDGKTVCLVGNGSTLTDVIGGGFVLADIGSISMSEGDTALAAAREGNSVTFGDGDYTVSYDRGTNTLTLEINKDIDETTDAELSYRVYLVREPQRAGRYSLETNESAVLSYGDTGEFTYNVPALEYVVLPSYDPGPVNPVEPGEPDEPDEPDEPEAPDVPELERDDHFGYIVGRTETTVAPEADITRAEVATIFFRLLTDESRAAFWSTESGFTDVDAGDWYNNAVATMANAGVINGYEDGAFRPDAPITRAEFAAMAVRFYESEAEIDHDVFSDIGSSWARDEINLAHALDIVGGYSDGTFRPNANITRAEAVTIINNVLGREPDAANLHPDMKVWDDNSPDAWYYAEIQEATNSHTYSRDGGSEYWLTIEPLRDWEALEAEWANAYGK